ncbi:unnamed protein product [Trichogramma brassicae]|uniref:Integrase catalytic domain-containing protein n=1 Tax=Trichogramma brassicae TaxID=86971 RepID=A0A6H5ICQ2_9HYME|nr:unnamed protein product [Trichogramma brassicae]
MVTKAVHLEVTSGLTAEDFLAAYLRFALRRGGCKTIYSDNAPTFKAASAELSRLLQATLQMSGEIINTLALQGTEWKFIPPRAPHFGGLWESAVRSFKFHFKRVVGDNHLTYEEMTTLAVKIEACLNSRPMSPLSSSVTDEVVLTPAHFLVGSPILAIPEPTVEEPERLPPLATYYKYA